MDQLTSMRVFDAIVTYNSFRTAAEHLNLAPSVVSKHLSALEDHLGAILIERTTRKLKLTEVGQNYLENVKRFE